MRRILGLMVALALFPACKGEPAASAPIQAPPSGAKSAVTGTGNPHAALTGADNPHAAGAENPHAARADLRGKVLEVHAAPGYTYLRLQTADGEAWAAIPEAKVEVGTDVVVTNPAMMRDFASKTLSRTFKEIAFGSGLEGATGTPTGTATATPPAQVVAPVTGVDRAAGPGARSIAELFAESKTLAGQQVAIRGKVVKYSAGILGKNWLHLQDGTGSADSASNDLTVTTLGTASVGDVVTVRGKVVLDRDLGAGYRYPVLIEDAALER